MSVFRLPDEKALQEMLKRSHAKVVSRADGPIEIPVLGKPNKFHAKPTEVDGVKCDSKKEATYYLLLRDRQALGEIKNLIHHGKVTLTVNSNEICSFEPDFLWEEKGRLHAADVKGMKKGTAYQLFKVKANLFKAIHGTDVREV